MDLKISCFSYTQWLFLPAVGSNLYKQMLQITPTKLKFTLRINLNIGNMIRFFEGIGLDLAF